MTIKTKQIFLVLVYLFGLSIITCNGQVNTKYKQKAYDFFASFVDSLNSEIQISDALTKELLARNYSKPLRTFYDKNNYQTLWEEPDVDQALTILNASVYHGLNPDYYNVKVLQKLSREQKTNAINDFNLRAILDIGLTKSLYAYANDLAHGRLNPNNFDSLPYHSGSYAINVDSAFLKLVEFNLLMDFELIFAPDNIQYKALKQAFELLYKNNAGDSSNIPIVYPKVLLHKGDYSSNVAELKQKLNEKGYLKKVPSTQLFDDDLETAVKTLQQKHGLTADGVPGQLTYGVLNLSTQNYLNNLQANLERLRWRRQTKQKTHVVVNIPAFTLLFTKNDSVIFQSKVIIGKYDNQTPVIQSQITYLVFNPCWTVPNSIATKSILPKLKTDSSYLDKRNMFVCINGVRQNHSEIDFSEYTPANFPYKIFQNADAGNALGSVKFMFDNNYSIYLHDTPSKSLFAKDNRALSHGCVRVQNALRFSQALLYKHDKQTTKLDDYLSKGYPVKVYLNQAVPLFIDYFTCKYNAELDQVQFFNDIYAKDYKIVEALKE